MNNLVSIYVPSTNNVNQVVYNEQIVKRIAKLLSLRYGGASWAQINGAWFSEDLNELVIEPVTRVYAYAENLTAYDKAFIKMLASAVKTWMSQEAVAYEIFEYAPESGMLFA